MPPFPSVLIANRGEIAVRVATTARRLGMRVIAVYSEADAGAAHVAIADEAYPVGPPPPRESYLLAERIIEIATRAGAAAIHPGYGFLSENAGFAEACAAAGIAFVGPPPRAIRAMGLKDAAKALMQHAGVPVVPGYHGERQEPEFLRTKAYEIGYPVLIKAVAGGGGKGMRRVDRQLDFEAALDGARREAANAFGDPRVLVEKYVTSPRHVEIQVFGDSHGNVVHLFERDCSLQRRHQKVIEEAPAPGMTAEVRAAMGAAAVAAAKAVGYVGAGTVEFIADGSRGLREDGFYFMEMNTRLQVEHPVTETIAGLDLVELQFRVAAGEPLPFAQADLAIDGHAVEARLYAEEPGRGFLPSTGRLEGLAWPPATAFEVAKHGVRVDTGVRAGDVVTPFYDPMIAKVIAHGATRDEALDRLAAALDASFVAGPNTNAAFLAALARHPEFRAGRFDTGFIERHLADLVPAPGAPDPGLVAAGVARLQARATPAPAPRADGWTSPWSRTDAFDFGVERRTPWPVTVDGARVAVTVVERGGERWFEIDGRRVVETRATTLDVGAEVLVVHAHHQLRVAKPDPRDALLAGGAGDGAIRAPMHGKVTLVAVAVGDRVAKGDRLAIVEAMKMEHALVSPIDGTVTEILAAAGDQVAQGARVMLVGADA